MKILITGFEPFGGESINPAYEAVRRLPDELEAAGKKAQLLKMEVPVLYNEGAEQILETARREHPDAIVAVGQAGGRAAITVERIAVNVQDASAPDNGGVLKTDAPIDPEGPAAYFSTLPIRAMVRAMQEAGVPAGISNSAGLYICNDVMYHLLHFAAAERPELKCGFVHVPYTCAQVLDRPSQPSMSLAQLTSGLEAGLKAIIEML